MAQEERSFASVSFIVAVWKLSSETNQHARVTAVRLVVRKRMIDLGMSEVKHALESFWELPPSTFSY